VICGLKYQSFFLSQLPANNKKCHSIITVIFLELFNNMITEPLAKFKTRDCTACSERSVAVADAPRKDAVYQACHCEQSEAIPSSVSFARGSTA
jgi:hypothetical protein